MSVKVFGKDVETMLDSNGLLIQDNGYNEDDYYNPEEEEYFSDPYGLGNYEENYGGFRKIVRTKRDFS